MFQWITLTAQYAFADAVNYEPVSNNVSENANTPETDEPVVPVAQGVGTGTPALPEQPAPADPPADESTIGTGTSMALGCIAGTVVLIIFGLLFLFLSSLF